MKHSEKEIIDALNVIKNVCKENTCNGNCPFYDNFDCVINDCEPFKWEIVEDNSPFKAFK